MMAVFGLYSFLEFPTPVVLFREQTLSNKSVTGSPKEFNLSELFSNMKTAASPKYSKTFINVFLKRAHCNELEGQEDVWH